MLCPALARSLINACSLQTAIFAYRAVAGRDRAMFDTCNRLDYDEAQSAQNICVNMTGANYLEGELAGVKLDHGCSLLRNFRLYAGFKNFYNPLCC